MDTCPWTPGQAPILWTPGPKGDHLDRRRFRHDKRGFIDERLPAIAQRLNIDAKRDHLDRRRFRHDKRGFIDERPPAIAQRLNIDADAWKCAMQPRGNVFGRPMGKLDHMRLHANTLGQSWIRGLTGARKLYV